MNKLFTPFEIALQLKELGFNEPCLGYWSLDMVGDTIPYFRYNNTVNMAESVNEDLWYNHNELKKDYIWSAPLWQQVINFLEEEHYIKIDWNKGNYPTNYYPVVTEYYPVKEHDFKHSTSHWVDTKEEALAKAFEEAITIINLIKIKTGL